jgi:hypothetical protein
MTQNTDMDDFLAVVNDLRDGDQTVRTTAHTSSVSAEGWIVEDDAVPIRIDATTAETTAV